MQKEHLVWGVINLDVVLYNAQQNVEAKSVGEIKQQNYSFNQFKKI